MKLQRYDMEAVSYSGAWVKEIPSDDGDWVKYSDVAELESALCETCKDPRCEDSVVEHLKQKVARLEGALREIENMPVGYSHVERFYQMIHIAKDALEGK